MQQLAALLRRPRLYRAARPERLLMADCRSLAGLAPAWPTYIATGSRRIDA